MDTREKGEKDSVKIAHTFDWSKPTLLKQKLISELTLGNKARDKIIVDFLTEYTKLEEAFNDILYDQPNFDSLNTIAYSVDGKVYQCALDFEKEVESNGFSIATSEGMIYLSKNTEFIKSKTIEYLDSISIEFLYLYCNEIDSICCEDAALMISESSLVNRIYRWGELLEKVTKLKYEETVKSEFQSNLFLLYYGQDNTPSFDWEGGKFNQKYLDNMKSIIHKYPNSKAAREFTDFIELLEAENYQNTDKIGEFFKDKFNIK
jgi:hypothetical protein